MEILRKQIRRAHRRLIVQSFVGKLAWCWFVTLLLAALAIATGKFWPPIADERAWALGSLATALGVGLVAAIAWTWSRRQDALAAAVEIDRRFGLKERISSTLALGPSELQSEIGQALVRDAAQRIERIDVSDQFGFRFDRRTLLPLVPAAVAFALALFVNGRGQDKPAAAATTEVSQQIKKSTQELAKKLDAQRKQAEELGLDEANALLKQLEQRTKDLGEKTQADKKQTLVALNDLVKDAEKRRQQLAPTNELKQQLGQLKNIQQGPAQQMAAALKTGNLKKAIAEVAKLQEKLEKGQLSAPEKQDLAKQLEQMQQALEKIAQAHEQAQEELKERIEAERRAGNTAEAAKLQEQLDKLAQKGPQMQKAKDMALQLKAAAQNLAKGQAAEASQALGKLSNELAGMSKELEELGMLEGALEEVGDCKNAMACKECEGEGCAACQGNGLKPSDKWRRSDFAKGGGVGAGKRDKAETDAGFVDSQVKQNVGKGAMVFKGEADGPNKKGQVQEAIKSEFTGAAQESAEALSDQRLPHDYRDHAKGYFEALRQGQK